MKFYEVISMNIATRNSTNIILLFRDYLKKDEKQFEAVKKDIKSEYSDKSNDFISLLKLENISKNTSEDDDDANEKRPFKIRKFRDQQLKPLLSKLVKKPMHSINDVSNFYNHLNKNINYKNNAINKTKIEIKLEKLFADEKYDKKVVEQIFPLAHLNQQIQGIKDEIKKIVYDENYRKKKRY